LTPSVARVKRLVVSEYTNKIKKMIVEYAAAYPYRSPR
jgi:hypothetical protein